MNIFRDWSVLAVGPHPDDIELGCAGVIMKAKGAHGLIITQPTDSREITRRRREAEEASFTLGYGATFLELPENFPAYTNVVKGVEWFLQRHESVDAILIPWPQDTHQDHRLVSEAVMSACRRFPGWIIYYNLPSSEGFIPNLIVEMTPEEYARKQAALRCHKSQRAKPYMDQDALDTLFHFWGSFYKRTGVPCEPYHIKKALVR